ncbi:hypothetical protein ACQ86B_21640 [Mycolicibacterium aichiense]|uniref:hypothetical protein n=1 Tax=Mycolicibacterium aichiense TaxID=1799 RepID=UPI003D670680
MTQRQVLLGTGAMVVGLGAALLSGSAVAHADNGDSSGSKASSKASSSAAGKSTGASKRTSTPSSATRTPRSSLAAQKANPTAAATSAPTTVTAGVATSRRAGMRSLAAAPSAPASDLLASAALSVLANLGAVPRTTIPAATTAPSAPVSTATTLPVAPTNGVTGVLVGHSRLDLPGAFIGKTVAADWYFPTQADGSVDAQGVIWLQHGFGATNTFYSALAKDLAQQTNSIVVAPTLSSIPMTFSGGCLTCVVTEQDAAALLGPNRATLLSSATAAGFTGAVLPERFLLAGHSAGVASPPPSPTTTWPVPTPSTTRPIWWAC